MMRYFRTTPATYEAIRAQLDSAWGYPSAATATETAIPPASTLPSDSQGRVYLAVETEYCEFILPSQMLPQLLASGAVEEVDEATYRAAVQPQEP